MGFNMLYILKLGVYLCLNPVMYVVMWYYLLFNVEPFLFAPLFFFFFPVQKFSPYINKPIIQLGRDYLEH